MSDAGSKKTDKEIKKLEAKLDEVYSQAEKEIQEKLETFTKKYMAKSSIHLQELKEGKITQEQYNSWQAGQIFQSQQWASKKSQIVGVIHNTNNAAVKMVNGDMYGVFAFNGNYQAYEIEKGFGVNFGFGLYDTSTVVNLIKNDPQILPKWKIDEKKDYIWNYKKVNNAITQGIIQGESLDKISKRLSEGLCAQNENLMKTFARTGMTQAQNAGRYQRQMEAKKLGINMVKEWMSTLDGRTRDSHRHMDGEKIKVGDKWHPQKFSNGLRYPGDPEGDPREIYNCRCTLVADLVDYPAEYERYDNIDGKPIKNMTYDEWAKAKGGVGHTKTKYKKAKKADIDYSKYGDKKTYDILKKYKDVDDMIDNATPEEWKYINSLIATKGIDSFELDELMQEVKKEGIVKPKLTKVDKELKKAQNELSKLEKEIADKGADKVFSGIWKDQDITYADYEAKKHTIEAKKQYYEYQIQAEKDFLSDPNLRPMLRQTHEDNLKQLEKYLNDLNEFEKHGEEYYNILKHRDELKQKIKDLTPKPKASAIFGPDAYTQERKDNALWAQSAKEADNALRPTTRTVWQAATKEQRMAAYDYTAGSGGFNRPLRGYEGSWYNFKGIGNVDLNYEGKGKKIEELTELLKESKLPQDTWLVRGVSNSGLAGFLDVPESILSKSEGDLKNLLIGKEISDPAFLSCGSASGKGFGGNVKIYCPKGTQALYVEPFSAYGGGDDYDWDGVSDQKHFGSELETLLQRNTKFRVTKVEKDTWGDVKVEVEIVGQDPDEIKYFQ